MCVVDIENEQPRPIKGKAVEKVTNDNDEERYNSKCLRVNNNLLQDVQNFSKVMENILLDPTVLSWIDLSFNEITHIDDVRALSVFS